MDEAVGPIFVEKYVENCCKDNRNLENFFFRLEALKSLVVSDLNFIVYGQMENGNYLYLR